MARVKFDEMEKYSVKGGNNWFSLKDDGDVAKVRFLFDSLDELPITVHDVKVGENYRTVACLRDYEDPIHKCPLCESGNQAKVKLFIPLYDERDESIKFWQRPKSFGTKIASAFARYKDFPSHLFEIERHGKAGDRGTTYELFEVDSDNKGLKDFELKDAIGTVVMSKTAEEMNEYLETGDFSGEQVKSEEPKQERVVRRTPIRNSDVF